MTAQEECLDTPFLSIDPKLERYIGMLGVDATAVADLPTEYGLTMEEIGISAIHFTAYETGYDEKTATLTLGVLTKDAPPDVVNPTRQHRSTLAHRSVPASGRPKQYFTERSKQLSRTLTGIVLERTVEMGYRSQEMLDLHYGYALGRGSVHMLAALSIVGGLYYANETGFFDTPVGAAMPLGGLLFVAGLDWLAVDESHRQEAEAVWSLADLQKLEAESATATGLVTVAPPGLPQTAHTSARRPKPRKNRRPVTLAGGNRQGL